MLWSCTESDTRIRSCLSKEFAAHTATRSDSLARRLLWHYLLIFQDNLKRLGGRETHQSENRSNQDTSMRWKLFP